MCFNCRKANFSNLLFFITTVYQFKSHFTVTFSVLLSILNIFKVAGAASVSVDFFVFS